MHKMRFVFVNVFAKLLSDLETTVVCKTMTSFPGKSRALHQNRKLSFANCYVYSSKLKRNIKIGLFLIWHGVIETLSQDGVEIQLGYVSIEICFATHFPWHILFTSIHSTFIFYYHLSMVVVMVAPTLHSTFTKFHHNNNNNNKTGVVLVISYFDMVKY